MEREEYIALIKTALDPDKAAEALAQLINESNTLFDTIEGVGKTNEKLEAKVQELRDTNHRLFLRVADEVTNNTQDDEERELTPDEALAEFMNKLKGE